MDWYGYYMAALMGLPFLLLGFVCGMLFMRGNYIRVIRGLGLMLKRQERELLRLTSGQGGNYGSCN